MAFLNKYYRKVSLSEYLHEWGLPDVHNAEVVAFSSLQKEQAEKIEEWIWEPVKKPGFHVVSTKTRRI